MKIEIIQSSSWNNGVVAAYYLQVDNFNIQLIPYPTGNCQLFSIAYMNNILEDLTNSEIKNLLNKLSYKFAFGKQMLLFDVSAYMEKAKQLGALVTPYTSSNGSKMCTGVLNITKIPIK